MTRYRPGALRLLVVAVASGGCAASERAADATAVSVLEEALARTAPGWEAGAGDPAVPVVYASGTLDQSGELQGTRPGGPDPSRFAEALAIRGTEVAQELRHLRVDGTTDHFREVHSGDVKTIHVLEDGFSVRLTSGPETASRPRVLRRFPHLLLAEALEAARAGRARLESATGADHRVSFETGAGRTISLDIAGPEYALSRVGYDLSAPGIGDTRVVWFYDEYGTAGPVRVPFAYRATVGGAPLLYMRVDSVVSDSGRLSAFFAAPEGHGPPIEVDPGSDPSADASVEAVSDGVYIVRSLRAGFHPMFVEFDDFVVAIDAPAGYPLMFEIPAGDVAPAPTTDWLSRRYIELIRRTLPDKPIRYVVLTHFHNDHAGGVRAFVAEGATVVAGRAAEEAIRAFYEAPQAIAPDELARHPAPLSLHALDAPLILGDDRRSIEIYPLEGSPHAADMLFVHLPDDDLAFESDLLNGVPADDLRERADEPVISHTLRWLEENGIDPATIYSMHAATGLDREARRAADAGSPSG